MSGRLEGALVSRPRRAGSRFDWGVGVAALGVCAASGLAPFARAAWPLELLSHFRLQYVVLCILLVALCLVRRRWRSAGALLPFVAINAVALAPYRPHAHVDTASTSDVEILTANLNAANEDYARFIALARAQRPDLILLLEADPAWSSALEALALDYPYRLELARDDPFGISLLSRLPLNASQILDLDGAPALDTRVVLADGREFRLLGVHLSPPMSAARAAKRNRQLAELASLAAAEAGPLLVTGDLNVTPYSPYLTRFLVESDLTDSRVGRGFGITWPTYLPIMGIPIDHCLVSEHFIVADQAQGPAFGSDHYPVITRLELRGSE